MRFDVAPELRLFGESVRAALGDWEPMREPDLGAWLDDRDGGLDRRLLETGWHELWTAAPEAVVAGALELGRFVAPMCAVDEAALGAPLAVAGRVRHGVDADTCVLPRPGWGLAQGRPAGELVCERTLDGSGTVRTEIEGPEPLDRSDADARWNAWTCATLAYLAGLAAAALEIGVEHARSREQFGRPLAAIPAVQARLADAKLTADSLELTAWRASAEATDPAWRAASLLWAGSACREVTLSAHQVHGAVGFALETGLHRFYRRAKSVQVWAAAVTRECA